MLFYCRSRCARHRLRLARFPHQAALREETGRPALSGKTRALLHTGFRWIVAFSLKGRRIYAQKAQWARWKLLRCASRFSIGPAQRSSGLHVTFSVRLHAALVVLFVSSGRRMNPFPRYKPNLSSLLSPKAEDRKTLRAPYRLLESGSNPFLVRLQNFSLEAVFRGEWLLSTMFEEGCQVKKKGKPDANMPRIVPTEAESMMIPRNTKTLELQGSLREKLVAGVGFEPTTFRL